MGKREKNRRRLNAFYRLSAQLQEKRIPEEVKKKAEIKGVELDAEKYFKEVQGRMSALEKILQENGVRP